MSSMEPEIIVGIDFGMNFTGVAYSNRNMLQPKVIQKWPGKLHESSRKVPSIIRYASPGVDPEWGFPCLFNDDKKEWFKQWLDPEFLDQLRTAEPEADLPSTAEVRKWYRDYMRCIYLYISSVLQTQIGAWDSKRIEFLFSLHIVVVFIFFCRVWVGPTVPTTFRSQAISTSLRKLLIEAGFSQGRHTIEFSLTESQASAVDAAKDSLQTFHHGDVMLVCDAGGATTDFALLEQISDNEENPKLQELATIPGIDVGSTNIDLAFEELVDSRLRAGGVQVAENTAWTMMHSPEFQEWKCSFGDPSNNAVPKFLVPVPQLHESVSNRAAGIERGEMAFSHDDFRALFDPQVNRIIALIRNQLNTSVPQNKDVVIPAYESSCGILN
ncbi:uncharacterized protein K444DRAFT_601543 [Hyaloscypha bicolor E]|uniref:Actin-like ATPase domain-containing protein n=1 Tax=Hyaloscypha bicolor E TaxID=1095630 RepID=A0A2J6SKG9_9HELO|nr:uncharacterized protein K444DRAFT_601543 [Hyaloscypha bicolor E]PMD51256.1 hypothetical protein K444DRAFT_601543 [Hyaloscypha bicolor E]